MIGIGVIRILKRIWKCCLDNEKEREAENLDRDSDNESECKYVTTAAATFSLEAAAGNQGAVDLTLRHRWHVIDWSKVGVPEAAAAAGTGGSCAGLCSARRHRTRAAAAAQLNGCKRRENSVVRGRENLVFGTWGSSCGEMTAEANASSDDHATASVALHRA